MYIFPANPHYELSSKIIIMRILPILLEVVKNMATSVTIDAQGRILIPALLRDSAQVRDEVSVQGHLKYLEIWNAEILRRQLDELPFSEEHEQALSKLGI